MAEKYGVVPPKFTKEWWPYFWMYYKWHTIATAFVILCVAITIQQCVTAPKYDLTATYTGATGYSEEAEGKIADIIREYTDDIDGNGEPSPYFQQLIISENQADAQYNYAMQTKLMLEFQNDCSFIFMMDSGSADELLDSESLKDSFVPVSEWIENPIEEELLHYSEDGKAYAVNLKNSTLLKNAGIPCEDIYIALKENGKEDEANKAAFENSKKILNAIMRQ